MFKAMSLGGLSWKELGRRVYAETMDDDVLGRAAQLSYYFLLALFPALLFITSLLGYLAGEDSRYWGFVPRHLVIGRAMFVYWSFDESAPSAGNFLVDFFRNTRWARTGTLVK